MTRIVEVPSIQEPIQPSPGFAKKGLSDYKLDLLGLCGFGCRYCSSNHGNYLRINRKRFAEHARQQLGQPLTPTDDPTLMYAWPDILDRLRAQLDRKPQTWGQGKTLVFSMLTDAFSPWLVQQGITRAALELLIERTSFRIRVLTKNAIVAHEDWLLFFMRHRDRFIVGLSIGTLNDQWAKRVEIGTSLPRARLGALQDLQFAGVPTFGMMCPVFPDVLEGETLELLASSLQPEFTEHIWAEPFNDRMNWRHVRDGYDPDSAGYRWFTNVYEHGRKDLWSDYALKLYLRLRHLAAGPSHWVRKLRYLLYEDLLTPGDAVCLGDMKGILLQSKPDESGYSRNPHIARIQKRRRRRTNTA